MESTETDAQYRFLPLIGAYCGRLPISDDCVPKIFHFSPLSIGIAAEWDASDSQTHAAAQDLSDGQKNNHLFSWKNKENTFIN